MANFSFDIISDHDKAEMNNVLAGAKRDISNRYDFKNTPAAIDWLEDKKGFKITGSNDWQLESITDIIRKNLASHGQTSKSLDLTKEIQTNNMQSSQEIPFIAGLDQEKSKNITKLIRDHSPKAKTQIQGDTVRVTSSSKDTLQQIIKLLNDADFPFPLSFINYR